MARTKKEWRGFMDFAIANLDAMYKEAREFEEYAKMYPDADDVFYVDDGTYFHRKVVVNQSKAMYDGMITMLGDLGFHVNVWNGKHTLVMENKHVFKKEDGKWYFDWNEGSSYYDI